MWLAFADTFYWIALADYTDTSHQQAVGLTTELAAWEMVTTDEVLTEYLNCFSKSIEPSRRQVMKFNCRVSRPITISGNAGDDAKAVLAETTE